jgi:hypothetical protein
MNLGLRESNSPLNESNTVPSIYEHGFAASHHRSWEIVTWVAQTLKVSKLSTVKLNSQRVENGHHEAIGKVY